MSNPQFELTGLAQPSSSGSRSRGRYSLRTRPSSLSTIPVAADDAAKKISPREADTKRLKPGPGSSSRSSKASSSERRAKRKRKRDVLSSSSSDEPETPRHGRTKKPKSILKTPGSSDGKRKKKSLVWSPDSQLRRVHITYAKSEYDRTPIQGIGYECDACDDRIMWVRFECPVRGCDFCLCEACNSNAIAKAHRRESHSRARSKKFKFVVKYPDDE